MLSMHESQWRELLSLGLERLPHALLLTGAAGLGKRQFADQLVRLMLCERIVTSGLVPSCCGDCDGCRWLASSSHPDVRYVSPDNDDGDDAEAVSNSAEGKGAEAAAPSSIKAKPKKRANSSIKVAAIRALEEFVFVGSHRQGRRVIFVTDADAMNNIAANALLKVLEEPPANVYFILITSRPDRLLRTLRSRCRQLGFVRPQPAAAIDYIRSLGLPKGSEALLALAGGAPLQVARWHETGQIDGLKTLLQTFQNPGTNPLILAGRWDDLLKKDGNLRMEFLVEAVQRWTVDAALKSSAQLDSGAFGGWRGLLQCRRAATHPLNQLLFLEELASHAMRATGKLTSQQRVMA